MQRELKVGLLLTAMMAAGLLKAQTIDIYANSEVIFNMEADYWGEPIFQYSPDSVIWEGIDINLNEPFVVNEGMSGYYRLLMVDTDCDSSYVSQVQVINVLPASGTVTNPITGQIWIDRNLGASQVATSATDTAAYGDFYQWGKATTEFTIVPTAPYDWSVPQNNNLWQDVNGINNPCPAGFRIPTIQEWDEEWQSWSSEDMAGAFNSSLKLTVAGFRYAYNGMFTSANTSGHYWSSTVYTNGARYMYIASNEVETMSYYHNCGDGASVRCIKD